MKLIRRFFIYLASIIAVLFLTYGYVYWGDLFGKDTPVGYFLNPASNEEVTINRKPEVLDETSATRDKDESVSAAIKVIAKPEGVQPSKDVVVITPQLRLTEVVLDKVDKAAIESKRPIETSIPIGDLWKQARDSFHYRDYETSIESYQQLIARTKDNFDAFEELGDVYNYYGKKKQAAAAYYGAATILVRLGRIDHAADFMKPLTLTDTVKAKSLLVLIKKANKSR